MIPALVAAVLAGGLFGPVLGALRHSDVPVLLPAAVPRSANETLYVTAEAGRSRYDVEVAFAPNCNSATACHLADIIGERTAAPAEGRPVPLRDGTPARFVASACGASCDDATLTWRRGAFRYTVAVKAAPLAELLDWAARMTPVR